MKPEQLEIDRLRRKVAKLKAERDRMSLSFRNPDCMRPGDFQDQMVRLSAQRTTGLDTSKRPFWDRDRGLRNSEAAMFDKCPHCRRPVTGPRP